MSGDTFSKGVKGRFPSSPRIPKEDEVTVPPFDLEPQDQKKIIDGIQGRNDTTADKSRRRHLKIV